MQRIIESGMLFSLFLFIGAGNLFRCIPMLQEHNLLITECLLYACCILYLVINKKTETGIVIFSSLILLSFLCNTKMNEFNVMPLLYALRLICMVFSGLALGDLLQKKFQGDIVPFFSFLLKAYLLSLLIGLCIYILFPYSEDLWTFLKLHYIQFKGDPHIGRFVSVYFDPNFWGAIGCLPFILSCFLFSHTQKNIYFLAACLFSFSILLTQSRSGIALFFFICFFFGILCLKQIAYKPRPRWHYLSSPIFLTLLSLLGVRFLPQVTHRILKIGTDPSAQYRFLSFEVAIEAVKEAPLLGTGYHGIKNQGVPIDSSLLKLIICFGLCIFIPLFALVFLKIYNFWIRMKQKGWQPMTSVFLVYIFVCVFFFSFFNELLTYPFWLIPVLVIYNFMNGKAHAVHRC